MVKQERDAESCLFFCYSEEEEDDEELRLQPGTSAVGCLNKKEGKGSDDDAGSGSAVTVMRMEESCYRCCAD